MAMREASSEANRFLDDLKSNDDLRSVLDAALDDSIFTLAVAMGAQQGLRFTRDDLEKAIVERIGLGEYRLSDPDGGAGKCKSSSGSRTPCVYCNSNRPMLEDLVTRGQLGRGPGG